MAGLSRINFQLRDVFYDDTFASSITSPVAKANYDYLKGREIGHYKDFLQSTFVLKYAAEEFFTSRGVTRESVKTSVDERERLEASQLIQKGRDFVIDRRHNASEVLVQEIPCQRFLGDLQETVRLSMDRQLSLAIEGEYSLQETHQSITKAFEDAAAKHKGIDESQLTFDQKLEMGREIMDSVWAEVALGDKIKLHFWAVILFVEAVWRTTIEAVAYAIHLVVPTWFENYRLEDREMMVQRQWQSLQVMAGAMFVPQSTLLAQSMKGVDPNFVAMDDLKTVGFGTAYAGQITATGGTSDYYPQLPEQDNDML